jgi:hypothetical protein
MCSTAIINPGGLKQAAMPGIKHFRKQTQGRETGSNGSVSQGPGDDQQAGCQDKRQSKSKDAMRQTALRAVAFERVALTASAEQGKGGQSSILSEGTGSLTVQIFGVQLVIPIPLTSA